MKKIISPLVLLAVVLMLPGCPGDDDERLVQVASQAADRQAAQNQEMAQLNREVAVATKQLVTANGQARVEFTALQQDLQHHQAEIAEQLTGLESERREIATTRVRESLLAAILTGLASLVIASLPLALAVYLLRRQQHDAADPVALGELLIQEFASDRPVLLPHVAHSPGLVGLDPPRTTHADQSNGRGFAE